MLRYIVATEERGWYCLHATIDSEFIARDLAVELWDDATNNTVWVVEVLGDESSPFRTGRVIGYASSSGDGGASWSVYKPTGEAEHDLWPSMRIDQLLKPPHHT